MADVLTRLLDDLAHESEALFDALQRLEESDWHRMTSSYPWTITDQVSHLAWNDDATVRALTDPERFLREKPVGPQAIQQMVDQVIVRHHDCSGVEVLEWFRNARASLITSFSERDPKARMPWYGPDMSLTSKVTARFMETWAHAHDIFDALGVVHVQTDRIRHVVFLGVQAIPNSFIAQGRPVPSEPVQVTVTSPSGAVWQMGNPEATNLVVGSAWELALLVTQRIHLADTDLRFEGEVAHEWLTIAQAFAGPPGAGRSVVVERMSED
jgi:uncharacterized protein (TIGR03084 family)